MCAGLPLPAAAEALLWPRLGLRASLYLTSAHSLQMLWACHCHSLHELCCGRCMVVAAFWGLLWPAGYMHRQPGCASVHLPLPAIVKCVLLPGGLYIYDVLLVTIFEYCLLRQVAKQHSRRSSMQQAGPVTLCPPLGPPLLRPQPQCGLMGLQLP